MLLSNQRRSIPWSPSLPKNYDQARLVMLLALVAFPCPAAGQPSKESQKAKTKTTSDLEISEITFKLKSPGKEVVWIQGNRFFTPTAFAIERTNLGSSSTSRMPGL